MNYQYTSRHLTFDYLSNQYATYVVIIYGLSVYPMTFDLR